MFRSDRFSFRRPLLAVLTPLSAAIAFAGIGATPARADFSITVGDRGWSVQIGQPSYPYNPRLYHPAPVYRSPQVIYRDRYRQSYPDRHSVRIRNSTLVNPTLVNPTIDRSILINPTPIETTDPYAPRYDRTRRSRPVRGVLPGDL
jgi:hypothetical protein